MVLARLVVLVVAIFTATISAQPTSRIWGGQEASKDGYPYAASVRLDGAHVCGGCIIGIRTILTAAHCLFQNGKAVPANKLAVRVGSTNQFSGGKLIYISTVNIHPEYNDNNNVIRNDIAVLKLETTLQWNERIKMVDIATSFAEEPSAGASVAVAGWGEQSADVTSYKLHSISLTVATDEVCSDAYSDNDSSIICLAHALKQGSCTGDAGNGAVYNNKLVGISSFVVGACGSRYPDVFTNVSYYASWIQSLLA